MLHIFVLGSTSSRPLGSQCSVHTFGARRVRTGSALFCVGGSAVFGVILVAAFLIIPPLAFGNDPKYHDEYSLTFSPEGIHFQTAQIDSNLEWTIYSRALVDAHSYLLYWGSRTFTVIPKRVFQNAEQQGAFDQLLVDHMPKVVRRG